MRAINRGLFSDPETAIGGSPFYFDRRRADAAVEFFPKFLKLTTAEWSRKKFVLADWQAFHTRQIFGWRRKVDGTRRYRRVRGFVPKKNGKTEWFAGIGHLLTIGDGEQTAEVYSYARNEKQALIIFNRARRMVTLDYDITGEPGPLASCYDLSAKSIFCPATYSAFMPLAGGSEGFHGPSVHAALGDEAHEWRDGTVHQALVDGMIARRQPLDAIFTTAGRLKTYAHELYDDAKAVAADPSLDPECYVFIYEADEQADWTSPATWRAANPNFGVSVKEDKLHSSCKLAINKPSKENDFKRMHLGLWTEQLERVIPMHLWKNNTAYPDNPHYWKKLDEKMRGRPCRGGIDLASDSGIAAVSYCFEPVKPGGRTTIIRRFFANSKMIKERNSPRTPFVRWVADKALIETPGDITDFDFIEESVKRDAELFRIKTSDPNDPLQWDIAIDRFQATQFTTHLTTGQGFKVARYGQEHANFNGPIQQFERLWAAGLFEHGNHPIVQWMYRNACIHKNPSGYRKPDKAKAADDIDGWVADLMAIGLTIRAPKSIDLSKWLKNPMVVG